jgi:hypothetical protein
MLLENKALIYCILGSHNEVIIHYLDLIGNKVLSRDDLNGRNVLENFQ